MNPEHVYLDINSVCGCSCFGTSESDYDAYNPADAWRSELCCRDTRFNLMIPSDTTAQEFLEAHLNRPEKKFEDEDFECLDWEKVVAQKLDEKTKGVKGIPSCPKYIGCVVAHTMDEPYRVNQVAVHMLYIPPTYTEPTKASLVAAKRFLKKVKRSKKMKKLACIRRRKQEAKERLDEIDISDWSKLIYTRNGYEQAPCYRLADAILLKRMTFEQAVDVVAKHANCPDKWFNFLHSFKDEDHEVPKHILFNKHLWSSVHQADDWIQWDSLLDQFPRRENYITPEHADKDPIVSRTEEFISKYTESFKAYDGKTRYKSKPL